METNQKEARLLADEFNPKYYTNKSFWMVPKGVMMLSKMSPGAKLLYAVLQSMAMKFGTAFPKKSALSKALGGVSNSTLYRWQKELIEYRLIRVLQKGRGLSNNYYLLKHPLIGNLTAETFKLERKYAYRGPQSLGPILVTLEKSEDLFIEDLVKWQADIKVGIIKKMPKAPHPLSPGFKEDIKAMRKWAREISLPKASNQYEKIWDF